MKSCGYFDILIKKKRTEKLVLYIRKIFS